MGKIKIVIVEDLEEVSEALAEFIRLDNELQLLASYRTAEAALVEIPLLKPAIVIMDINLPGITGIECVRKLKPVSPSTQFMMLTVYENNEQVFEALKAGANGYLLKSASPAEIIESIKELNEGGSPMSSTIARKLVSLFQAEHTKRNEAAVLTPREREVLQNLAKGMLYKEIGDQLGISFNTVRQHISKIYEKLHVQNRTEALNKVFGQGGK
jgi:DNA-binding NarL/FixJ family response regulator